jgi:hypothetical protein
MNQGTCPKCEAVVSSAKIEDIEIIVGFTPAWRGLSFLCPSCNTVLGVAIDPVALKTDIIEGVAQRLRGR